MYLPNDNRYDNMPYANLGNSGLKVPVISLGLWHNFGDLDYFQNQKDIIFKAFDNGITHFDLANNYGPPAGAAEENFGKILNEHLKSYRDEMIITSKAGFYMWPGPYGEWGSKKSIVASCNQSLQRLGLDYVDIFYHHRPDPNTPLEETAEALDLIVRQGKALYVGISNYNGEQTKAITDIFKAKGTPFVVHQAAYNMFERKVEEDLFPVLESEKIGMVAFVPLAQGLLTNRYLNGIPKDSRAARSDSPFLSPENVDQTISIVQELNDFAINRGQTLAQMAIAWILHQEVVSSVIIGASRVSQLEDNLNTLNNLSFSPEEIKGINEILNKNK